MSDLSDYLYAASVMGLAYKINDIDEAFGTQDDTEEFIYECLRTNQDIDGINTVLERFANEGIVQVVEDELAGNFYRFEKNAILGRRDIFRDEPDSIGGKMATVGLQLFHNALENAVPTEGDRQDRMPLEAAPAADRLVSFDHNSAQTEELIALTEGADEAIRGANSMDEEQRGWIRAHIQTGIEFIRKNKKMLAGAAAALLLKPLQAAYEAVAEEPARIAIQAAIDAVKMMFGI